MRALRTCSANVAVTSTAALVLAAIGCTAMTAQDAFRGAGDPVRVRAALARSKSSGGSPLNRSGKPMAFLVTTGVGTGGPEIIAVDLSGPRVVWRKAADVAARVAVGSSVIVAAERGGGREGELVGRDLQDGAIRWRSGLPSTRSRVGYAIDGDDVYEVSQPAGSRGGTREATLTAYDGKSGSVRYRVDLVGESGAPAARGGIVAVPRRSQYVTLIDGASGEILADILSRQEAATFVRALPEGLFFGSRGVFLASHETAMGGHDSGGYLQAKLPPFVRPLYHFDMYRANEADYSALDRNRVLWRVTADQTKASFTGGQVVVHNFRFFFGFDAATGSLRWAYSQPRTDVAGAEHTGGRIVFVTAEGELGALDAASGRRVWKARVPGSDDRPLQIRGVTFDVEGFSPQASAAEAKSLPGTLADIAWEHDTRFTEAKIFAVTELAKLPGKEVTRELLRALEGGAELPGPVVNKAIDALIARQDLDALDLYVKALQVHPDYAEDRRPTRLDVFARAVTALKAKQALPALVEHLRLPDTDQEFVRDVAEAVIAMQARDATEPFSDFLLQYRADPAFNLRPQALMAACDVLLKLGGSPERTTLLFVAEDARTLAPLRAYIWKAFLPAGSGKN